MEKFVLDYSTYLAAFDLVFGCLPDDRPTWASPAAPASRREDDAAEGDSPRKENAGVENSSNQAMKEKKAKKAKKTSGGRTVFRAEQQKTLLVLNNFLEIRRNAFTHVSLDLVESAPG